ncbi:MAG TPA: hypothetical protein VFF79_19610 [Conexibacter sp.]|nr:hypothetical protein [Conexibacter sp.]
MPRPRLPHRTPAAHGDDGRLAVRLIAILAGLALALWLLVGPFAGILLFVAGLAALAAWAATHPHGA